MNLRIKRTAARYFDSLWLPTAVHLALLGILAVSELPRWRLSYLISNTAFGFVVISLVGILSAAIWNLAKTRWAAGWTNLAMLPICAAITLVSALFLLMFGPSEDHFADDLNIPTDIAVAEPFDNAATETATSEDKFKASLLSALDTPGSDDASVTVETTSLIRLQQTNPDILRRYFATSPAWRVFKDHGGVFATRRWMIGSSWQYEPHGNYSRPALNKGTNANVMDFQFRFTIGFSGKPWAREGFQSTRLRNQEKALVRLSKGNRLHASHCVIGDGDLIVEVFEQSDAKERRLTKAALNYLNEELRPLVDAPSWTTIKANIPAGSIRLGKSSFDLRKSYQPGLYLSELWINPGEPGMIYLKAFEVTKSTSLSVASLKQYSNEWVGWSDNPEDLFLSNTFFEIHEGDWGKPYAARFELWFVPDSGQSERKLMEKVFKIEGWQR